MPLSVRTTGDSSPELTGYHGGQSLQVDGLRIWFARAGAGPALVLVHGLLGSVVNWRPAIPLLAREREVFALDMPGAGLSDWRPDLDCRLSSAARRLLGFLDAAGISSCDLVGSSYGGATTVVLAALAPSRVRRLILVSPANPWSKIGRKRLRLLQIPLVGAIFPRAARNMPFVHPYFVRRMYGDPNRVTRETLDGHARPLALLGRFEHAVKIARNWRADMQELGLALMKASHVPTLLVWGSKDRTVDPASAEPLRQRFHSAELAIIEGAGHLPYEECPEEFTRIVTDFLNQVPASAGPTGK